MEKEFKVEAYGVRYMCDHCKEGEMVPNGQNSFAHQVRIGHRCNKCNMPKYFEEKYPTIRYREV